MGSGRLAASGTRRIRPARSQGPSLGMIRTVLGDVESTSLGRVDTHEHLVILSGPFGDADRDVVLDDLEDAIAEVEAFRAAGGGAIIDALPIACGRDPGALAAISRATGVTIIATTGFHRAATYPARHWVHRYPIDVLTAVVADEVATGVDAWDLVGPAVERTGVRPGVLKLSTSHDRIDPVEQRMLSAVAAVHRSSGLPILTHAENGTFGLEQLDRLADEGVDASRVMVGHLDRAPDRDRYLAIAARGAFLGLDGLYREARRPWASVADIVVELVAAGHDEQVLLGGDVGRRSMRRSAGGLGVAGLLTETVPTLVRAGVTPEAVQRMLVSNAAKFLEVRPAHGPT